MRTPRETSIRSWKRLYNPDEVILLISSLLFNSLQLFVVPFGGGGGGKSSVWDASDRAIELSGMVHGSWP